MSDLTLFTVVAAAFGLLFVLLVAWQWWRGRATRGRPFEDSGAGDAWS